MKLWNEARTSLFWGHRRPPVNICKGLVSWNSLIQTSVNTISYGTMGHDDSAKWNNITVAQRLIRKSKRVSIILLQDHALHGSNHFFRLSTHRNAMPEWNESERNAVVRRDIFGIKVRLRKKKCSTCCRAWICEKFAGMQSQIINDMISERF